MSCVIGLKHDGKVYIGSDGVATTEDGDTRPIICKKVFFNEPYLIGFCGSVRSGQLLYENSFEPPENVLDFPQFMRDHFMENGSLLAGTSEVGDRHEANILIGTKEGKLYEILVDFQMSEVIEFTCIGSGGQCAFGSMEVLKRIKGMNPRIQIMTALEVASKYSMAVGPPYKIKVI